MKLMPRKYTRVPPMTCHSDFMSDEVSSLLKNVLQDVTDKHSYVTPSALSCSQQSQITTLPSLRSEDRCITMQYFATHTNTRLYTQHDIHNTIYTTQVNKPGTRE